MNQEIEQFLGRLEELIVNANTRNRELSGELTFIREQNLDIDFNFARNLEAQAYRIHGELLAYEKVQKLCENLIEEEDDDQIF
jgi:hypothetical protein